MSLQRYDDDERAVARVMARAEIFARMPGLKKEIANNPGAVAAIMLSLQGEGLPLTLRNINGRYHFIEGQATDTAAAITAMAFRAGYRIDPIIRTDELAVVAITGPDGNRVESEYNIGDAGRAGHTDEWVEKWEKNRDNSGWAPPVKFVIRRGGQPINEPWPEWAVGQVEAGRVKRFDAWWKYPADMLYKSAAVRAVRMAAPHVLLGDTGPVASAAPGRGRPQAVVAEQDYIDVEAVDEPTPPRVHDNAPESRGMYAPDDPERPF